MKGFMMMKTKTKLSKVLESVFPKTTASLWWRARATGRRYGVNQALYVLDLEMKRLHKESEIPPFRVKAKEQAKYLQTLIRLVKRLNDVE
jgi:hypothetical protein